MSEQQQPNERVRVDLKDTVNSLQASCQGLRYLLDQATSQPGGKDKDATPEELRMLGTAAIQLLWVFGTTAISIAQDVERIASAVEEFTKTINEPADMQEQEQEPPIQC